MGVISRHRPAHKSLIVLGALTSLVVAGPCDIYSSGGTPCVAAHSTTRALSNAYSGPLYQVQRASDKKTTDVKPLSAGGVANAKTQDDFCASTTCLISKIYDQSGNGNHLTAAPPGSAGSGPGPNGYDNLASATGAPVTLNGKKAYGVFIDKKSGYRNDATKGISKGDDPEGIYALLSGKHFDTGCCFDYGNAEIHNNDTGSGSMEAIYFGTGDGWSGKGQGSGPWVMADLENYLFSGGNKGQNNDPTITWDFVVAAVKGEKNNWAIRGGDANSGSMQTFYSGARPTNGWESLNKEGAIILGIGGDNSNGGVGTFYEGVLTHGFPSDDTENKVQADIVKQRYAAGNLNTGADFQEGDSVSFQNAGQAKSKRARSAAAASYLSHSASSSTVHSTPVSSSSGDKQAASWTVRKGLAVSDCYSFESQKAPGSFLRHQNATLFVDGGDGTKQFAEDATFCTQSLGAEGTALRSWNDPTRFVRLFGGQAHAATNGGGPNEFDTTDSFNDDATWIVGSGLV